MKKIIIPALTVGLFFGLLVMFQDSLGAKGFFLAALSFSLVITLSAQGGFMRMTASLLSGLVIGLAAIMTLALAFPLPPDNNLYVALITALSLIILVVLSPLGLRLDGMLLGWGGIFAVLFPIYFSDPTVLESLVVSTTLGTAVSLAAGLVLALAVAKLTAATEKE